MIQAWSFRGRTTHQYDVYAEVAGSTGSATTPYDFAGEQTDASTGLQYLRARYMDPATGTFISREPLAGDSAWIGRSFGYAGASPVGLIDPAGTAPVEVGVCSGPYGGTCPQGTTIGPYKTAPYTPACPISKFGCWGWDIIHETTSSGGFRSAERFGNLGVVANWIRLLKVGAGVCVSFLGAEYRFVDRVVQDEENPLITGHVRVKQWQPKFSIGVGIGLGKFGYCTAGSDLGVDFELPWDTWGIGGIVEERYWRRTG